MMHMIFSNILMLRPPKYDDHLVKQMHALIYIYAFIYTQDMNEIQPVLECLYMARKDFISYSY